MCIVTTYLLEVFCKITEIILQALRLLPEDTKLQDVEEFMCAILRDRTKDSRRNLLLKSLNLSDNLKVGLVFFTNFETDAIVTAIIVAVLITASLTKPC